MEITEQEYKRYPFLKPRDGWYGATEIPQGWHDIVMIMSERILQFLNVYKIPVEKYHCDQGKEKWGEFCWYDSFDEDVINSNFILDKIDRDIVSHFRCVLLNTCTICGKPAVIRRKSWIEPLCDECYDKTTKK